ncbi:MAG: metallophosphoesterase [Pseudomonadales bacterium]
MTAPLRLLQISDTHLKAIPGATLLGVDTAACLERVLDQALAEACPDAIIASGDIAHDPDSAAAYRRFLELIESRYAGPLLTLPGNHDLTGLMAGALPGADVLRLGRWAVVAFDTHVDHRVESGFDAAARGELETRIRGCDADFLLLACHHPPLPVGCPWLDKDCIPAGAELLDSCAAAGCRGSQAQSRVRGLVFGHIHQQFENASGPLVVLGTPSTCFQFPPAASRFAIDRDAVSGRPGYRWLELGADGALVSNVRRLDGEPLNIDLSDRS